MFSQFAITAVGFKNLSSGLFSQQPDGAKDFKICRKCRPLYGCLLCSRLGLLLCDPCLLVYFLSYDACSVCLRTSGVMRLFEFDW